ncbi:serine--tRNA synthetase-like protein Slimp [Sitodiplosis mosellana]|uniref:serine--tRNA synthetase-like protein Slimp n=1 Tax=Sitodiplosis mosellana TaxID=263140 RepID=UPI00244464E5|nr:serine--tRNA synthetase-like protein Slimp [Sitodiplosis mosellana]
MLIRLLRVNDIFNTPRRFVQALYVGNKNIKKNLRLLTPILDFEHRLSNPKDVEDNLRRRGLSEQFDVNDLFSQWEMYSSIKSKKEEIENLQKEASQRLKEAKYGETLKKREDARRKYALELETLAEDLSNCTGALDEVEEKFVKKFLSLPNETNCLTPQEVQIVSSFGTICNEKREHHLAYEDSIEYYSNTAYFLKGDAAKFDNSFSNYCINYFRKHNFIDFSNPDFAKTILVEGAGLPLEKFYEVPHELDVHHTNWMHLVGNSSMLSFLGYAIKLRVWGKYIPLQWISAGRTYSRTNQDTFSLYNVSQSSTVQIFQAGSEEQMLHKFKETLAMITQLFQKLDVHFRILYTPAKELNLAESLSAKIEMFSPHSKKYIEVGNLNYYSDYISKRLLFSYVKDRETNEIGFAHIVSGTVCNLTRILAIILETNNGIVPSHLLDEFV